MPGEWEEYERLSNEELTRALHVRFPELGMWPVTDETRNTAIGMLKISGNAAGTDAIS